MWFNKSNKKEYEKKLKEYEEKQVEYLNKISDLEKRISQICNDSASMMKAICVTAIQDSYGSLNAKIVDGKNRATRFDECIDDILSSLKNKEISKDDLKNNYKEITGKDLK